MKKVTMLAAAVFSLASCNIVNNLVHDDQVVAKAGGERLYRSELAGYIPDGVSSADSAAMADQYIRSWASGILFVEKAQKELSKEERDMEKELEDYRKSLLRYRYEQLYINARLDTLITDAQVSEFYEAHKESFVLSRPILRVRFIDLMKEAPNRQEIMDKLSAKGGRDQQDLDSLAYVSSIRYIDSSEEWLDAGVLAREFATDWETMLSHLKDKYIIMDSEESGDVRAAYVFDIIRKGTAPLEFCRPLIKDNILSARKRGLLEKLEQDLLTEALEKKDFVKYEE